MNAKLTCKLSISLIFIILLLSKTLNGQDPWWEVNGWNNVHSRWQTALSASINAKNAEAAEELERATASLRDWREDRDREFISRANQQQLDSYQLLDFRQAQAWANARDYNKAFEYFQKETSSYTDTDVRFLANTRNPSPFAHDVFALHSEIMAHTGIVTVPPGAGYEVLDVSSKNGSQSFAFVYEPVESDEGGVAIEGVADDEHRQVIELSIPNETGRYEIADRAQVIGKRDGVVIGAQLKDEKPTLRVSGVTKFIEYKGEFRVPFVRVSPISHFDLAIDGDTIQQPVDAIELGKLDAGSEAGSPQSSRSPLTESNPSPAVNPPATMTPSETDPKAAVDASRSTWWLVVALVVAASGLLWILLKKWK